MPNRISLRPHKTDLPLHLVNPGSRLGDRGLGHLLPAPPPPTHDPPCGSQEFLFTPTGNYTVGKVRVSLLSGPGFRLKPRELDAPRLAGRSPAVLVPGPDIGVLDNLSKTPPS